MRAVSGAEHVPSWLVPFRALLRDSCLLVLTGINCGTEEYLVYRQIAIQLAHLSPRAKALSTEFFDILHAFYPHEIFTLRQALWCVAGFCAFLSHRRRLSVSRYRASVPKLTLGQAYSRGQYFRKTLEVLARRLLNYRLISPPTRPLKRDLRFPYCDLLQVPWVFA